MLDELLNERQTPILKRWFHQIAETYPLEGAKFLTNKKDQFNNPVGYTFSREIEVIYSQLLNSMDKDMLSKSLENIIKIRNVQEFTPSQAISFIFILKKAIRDELNQEIADKLVVSERTVGAHVSNILAKLHLANRTQAALYALRKGFTDLTPE